MSQRKRKGRPVSGWLNLDKPVGMSSTLAVSMVKRMFGAAKAGHAGTLDPLASGALPIALGEATKAVPQVFDGQKTYRFTVRWGVETDTDDSEGRPVATTDLRPSAAEVEAALPAFTGEIMQVPPAFSAIRVDGERAYDLARDGETLALEPRPVVIHRLTLAATPDPDTSVLEAECGKGTYVRAIARDLGRRLGARGHVSALRRLAVGPFTESTFVTMDAVRATFEEGGTEACDALLLPVAFALGDLIELPLPRNDVFRVMQGQAVLLRGRGAPITGAAYATDCGRLLAVGEVEAGQFHPRRVFQL